MHKRQHFLLAPDCIYLDGNSLGPSSIPAQAALERVTKEEWQQDLIQSWNKHDWFTLPETVGHKIATIIGAAPDTVTVADSTSVNVFKLLSTALSLRADREIILTDNRNFPTDIYVAQGLVEQHRQSHKVVIVDRDQLPAAIEQYKAQLAVAMITQVDYTSGHCFDMAILTQQIQATGALALWDLAHSAGAVPLHLSDWGIDFAVGCGYKFLNGGPGAPAFVYVAPEHQSAKPMLQGWMGHDKPFAFTTDYQPAADIRRFRVGTPSILALSALDGALTLFDDVDMSKLKATADQLIELAMKLITENCPGIKILTPTTPSERGSQLSIQPEDDDVSAYAIVQALIAENIIGDFRQPNVARFGITPLYIGESDIRQFVDALSCILGERSWDQPHFHQQHAVT